MTSLLCVLDWGLGHASRSLALTERLEAAGETIHLASCGRARAMLQQALPGRTIHALPPYAVRYPTRSMPLNVALQLPRWLATILRERRATARLARELGVDRVISDSRFGCYVPGLPSVFLTHQLHPRFGWGPAAWAYRRYLRRFPECWVPDAADRPLSGALADPRGYRNVRFIGPLSRLTPGLPLPGQRWRTLSLLSGPEPMRGRLEAILREQLPRLAGPHLLVRGVPDAPDERRGAVTIKGFADREFLSRHLPAADYVICRSGYSTLMDLDHLAVPGHRILVPTPGQTEQEYLARTQVRSGAALASFRQRDVDLGAVLRR